MSNSSTKNSYIVCVKLRKNANLDDLDPKLNVRNEKGELLLFYAPYFKRVRAYNRQVASYIAWDLFKWEIGTYMPRTMFKITAKLIAKG